MRLAQVHAYATSLEFSSGQKNVVVSITLKNNNSDCLKFGTL